MKQYILNTKKIKKISLSFLALMIGILLFFSTFQYTAPFIIALFAAMILDPWISLARKKTRLPRNVVTLFSVFILLSLIFFLIYLVVSRLVFEAKNLLDTMPALATEIYNNILNMTDSSNAFWLEFPEEFIEFIMQFLEDLVASLGEFTNILIPRILDTAFSIPSAVIFFLITVIATYFFSSDKQLIIHYVEEQISPEIFEELRRIKNKIVFTLKKMLKAYLIIIAITFTELFIGFTLLGIEYAFVLASIIAIVDILPVLGTGGFLVPWAIFSFITGNISLGISLLVIYGITLVVRQIVEPKIVGKQIGIHPLLTLASMYIGLRTIGVTGIILGPFIFITLKIIFSVVFNGESIKELFLIEVDAEQADQE